MSDDTPLLALPLILPAQAQKHVTHNEALRLLDLLVHLAVIDRTRSEPPAQPAEGDRHIVASPATGLWQGHEGKVAAFWGGAWAFLTPRAGWLARVLSDSTTLAHNGTTWVAAQTPPDTLPRLGIAATADAVNRLTLSSPASLFDHDGAGHQIKVNKANPADTASLLFQTGYSGRAEMGLTGGDSFAIKVSGNGTSFTTALTADPATGSVTLPQPLILHGLMADPANPANGTIWHNAATDQIRAQAGGLTHRLDGQREIPSLTPPAGDLVLTTTGAGGGTLGTLAGAAGRIDLFPFQSRADLTVDRLLLNCTTAVAGALARILIYASDANGRPDAQLLETADLDLSTTGAKSATVALSLRQGRTVWLGIRHSSTATLSVWPTTATPDVNGGTAPITAARKVLRRTIAWGSPAPAPWGFTSTEINSAAATAIWLRVA